MDSAAYVRAFLVVAGLRLSASFVSPEWAVSVSLVFPVRF